MEQLELDVIGIPEDDHGVRNRVLGVDHAGVIDAELVEPGGPGIEICPSGDPERDVVQASPALLERLPGVSVMVVQPDREKW